MFIYQYSDFILENQKTKYPLKISDKLKDFLKKINTETSKQILESEGQLHNFSFLDLEEEDYIGYLPSDKCSDRLDDKHSYNNINRVSIKVGRLVKKILPNISNVDLEKFVNQYKNLNIRTEKRFVFYEGIDISNAFMTKNFFSNTPSALQNSCMNDCIDWVEFYIGCPVKMLVLVDENDKIHGRALIWNIEGVTFMDRVYYIKDYDYYKFTDKAISEGWIFKIANKSGNFVPYTKDGKTSKWYKLKIKLKFDFEKVKDWGVPYLDTFCFAQGNHLFNYEPEGLSYKLIASDGTFDVNENY